MLGKIILIFFVYLLIRAIIGYYRAKNVLSEMVRQAKQQAKPPKKEGQVTITYDPSKDKSLNSKDGDYVDYEELP